MGSCPSNSIGRRGFSLLEVVIGTVLVTMILGASSASWILHERATRKYRTRNLAKFTAQEEMERALAAGWDNLETVAAATPRNVILRHTVDEQEVVSEFEVTTEVNPLPGGDIKEVLVRVTPRKEGEVPFELESAVFWSFGR